MLSWLRYFLSKSVDYLTSPILYHASCDGLVMNTYYKVANMADTYGMLALLIVFIAVCCYYRNTFFNFAVFARKLFYTDIDEITNTVTILKNFFLTYLTNLFNSTPRFVTRFKRIRNLRS